MNDTDRTERTVRVWAVKRVNEDAFMFSSEDEQATRRWFARLTGYGHNVELVTCERHTTTYLRQTEWVPATAPNPTSTAPPDAQSSLSVTASKGESSPCGDQQ